MDILADPIEQEVNADGATPQGALFVSVKNTGATVATFNGVSLPPGEAKSYSFVGKGYKALPYVVNGSTLKILYIEKAQRIMQRYEDDYDNFLDKLKAKRKAKKEAAAKAKSEADKADKTVSEAEAHKKKHLGQKAKDLLDKVGGIEGATSTIQNVMGYFKSNTPSDYDINMGGSGEDPAPEKKIMGMPPMVAYGVGAVVVLAGLYGLSRVVKNMKTKAQAQPQTQAPVAAPVAAPVEPVLQAAA